MRSRLGELALDARDGQPKEIAISRRHVRTHGWDEVGHTMLHEMIHQWQAETGRAVDHGREFRRKARQVGVEPRARREMDNGKKEEGRGKREEGRGKREVGPLTRHLRMD